jgi:heme-degrading monooxygenase HmoA
MTDSRIGSFAIVHRYQVDPASDTRTDLWDQFVPKLKAIPGFLAVYTLDDPEAGEGVSFTLWDSAEAAQQYLDSSARQRLDELASDWRPATDRRLMRVLQADDPRISSDRS